MFSAIYYPSLCELPPELKRHSNRPIEFQDKDFYQQFDSTTLFYDVAQLQDGILLIGPPLNNLSSAVDFLSLSDVGDVSIGHFDKCIRGLLWKSKNETLRFDKIGVSAKVTPAFDTNVFKDLKVVVTLSKNNEIAWIKDWIKFYVKIHGAEGLILYDNGSTAYSVEDLRMSLNGIGLRSVVIVSWPYKYGPQGNVSKNIPFDSNFCQHGALEHARWTFLREASSFLNCDIDEFLIAKDSITSIFSVASAKGYVQFQGLWVEPVDYKLINPKPIPQRRHSDFRCIKSDRSKGKVESTKYCVSVPSLTDDMQCVTHSIIIGATHSRPAFPSIGNTAEFVFRHFRAINDNWHWKRDVIGNADREGLEIDESLVNAFVKVGL